MPPSAANAPLDASNATVNEALKLKEDKSGFVDNKFNSAACDGALMINAAQPGRFIRYEMRMTGRTMVVRGNLELESAGGGATLVMWFDTVDLGGNPLKRWLGLLLKPMLARAYHRNLAGLKTAVETGKAAGPGPK